MAGFRYWQLRFLHPGNDTYNEIASFEFRDTVGGANLATDVSKASMSAVGLTGAGVIDNLFDDDDGTTVRWQSTQNVVVVYDFGLGNERELLEIAITGGATPTRSPYLIAVRRSDDGVTWVTAWVAYRNSWTATEKKVMTRPVGLGACRYWAVVAHGIENAVPFMTCRELYLREIPGGALATGDGSAFETHENSSGSLTADKSFDSNISTASRNAATAYLDMLGYDFGVGVTKTIREVDFLPSGNNAPSSGAVIKSNNFLDWEVLNSFVVADWTDDTQETLYLAPYLEKNLVLDYTFAQPPAPLFDIIPNEPVEETWEWLTVISRAYGSKEQRNALRDVPRAQFDLEFTISNEDDRYRIQKLIKSRIGSTFNLPLFSQMTSLTSGSTIGSNRLYYDPGGTDIRDNDYLVLYNPQSGRMYGYRVASLETDGATLLNDLNLSVETGWMVMPSYECYFQDGAGLTMGATLGSFSLKAHSAVRRSLLLQPSPSLISLFDTYPLITDRPTAVSDLGEGFNRELEIQDNGTSLPQLYTSWDNSFISGDRQWHLETVEGILMWKEFLDTIKGKQKPFLLPTFRHDLPLYETPTLDTFTFKTTNVEYVSYFQFDTYKRVRIETLNGVIHRKITSAVDNGDGTATLTMSVKFGNSTGDNLINRISFLNLVRLEGDQVKFSHYYNYDLLSLSIRSIDQ